MKSELILKDKPKAIASENIRTVRTNLQFSLSLDKAKSILVTSSCPGEGKSFMSANLAIAFAQTGKKVILIDSDLRRGRLHKLFNLENEVGLSNLLSIEGEVSTDYIHKTDINNLRVITRGPVPPNPSELLNSDNMKKLIKSLKTSYDYIIFDGQPLNGLPDSLVLGKLVDRCVLVAASGSTSIDDLNNSVKALENIEAKIAGIVFNKVPRSKKDAYYY